MASHIIALDIKKYISADQSADAILREIRRQGVLSIACHPHHRAPRRFEISTCYLWDHREELADLVDVWEAANRDPRSGVAHTRVIEFRSERCAIRSHDVGVRLPAWELLRYEPDNSPDAAVLVVSGTHQHARR